MSIVTIEDLIRWYKKGCITEEQFLELLIAYKDKVGHITVEQFRKTGQYRIIIYIEEKNRNKE